MQANVNKAELKAFLGKCKRPALDQLIRLTNLPKTGYKLDLKLRLENYLDDNPSKTFLEALLKFKKTGNIGEISHTTLRNSQQSSNPANSERKKAVPQESHCIKWHNNNSNQKIGESIHLPTSYSLLKVPSRLDDLEFEINPFYKPIDTLIHPIILLPNIGTFAPGRNSYEKAINLNISQDVAEAITYHLQMTPKNQVEFSVQVILRFTVFDENECGKLAEPEQFNISLQNRKDDLPVYLGVSVNGKPLTLGSLLPCKKPGMDGRRDGRPVNITPLLRLSPFFRNLIQITWSHNYEAFKYHYVGVYLMVKQNPDELATALVKNSLLNTIESKERIVKQLSATNTAIEYEDDDICIMDPEAIDEDCVIPSSSVPIKILCPLTMSRLVIPVRGRKCKHIQCFDALTYLKINELKPKWHCPICSDVIKYSDLIVDEYFKMILEDVKNLSELDTIIFDVNGNWKALSENQTTSQNNEENKEESTIKEPETEDNKSTEILDPSFKLEADLNLADNQSRDHINFDLNDSIISPSQAKKPPENHVIDLTESDDEQTSPIGTYLDNIDDSSPKSWNFINLDTSNELNEEPNRNIIRESLIESMNVENPSFSQKKLASFISTIISSSGSNQKKSLFNTDRPVSPSHFIDSLLLKSNSTTSKRNGRDSLVSPELPPKRPYNTQNVNSNPNNMLELDPTCLKHQLDALTSQSKIPQKLLQNWTKPSLGTFSANHHPDELSKSFSNSKKLTNLFDNIQPSPQLQLDKSQDSSVEILNVADGSEKNSDLPIMKVPPFTGSDFHFKIGRLQKSLKLANKTIIQPGSIVDNLTNISADQPNADFFKNRQNLFSKSQSPIIDTNTTSIGVNPVVNNQTSSMSHTDIIRLIGESAKNSPCLPQLPSWFKNKTNLDPANKQSSHIVSSKTALKALDSITNQTSRNPSPFDTLNK